MTSYPHRHTGPAIVLGSAASALDDLAVAWSIYPNAEIIACNWMFRNFRCRHVVSSEPGFFGFPGAECVPPEFTRHVACDARYPGPFPGDPYVWPGLREGTCGLFGARMARTVGYAPVVLAGVQISQTGYIDGYVGGELAVGWNPLSVENIRDTWRRFIAAGELDGVRSMSGWTRDVLGAP